MCLQRKRKNHFYELNTMKHNWEYKKLGEVCEILDSKRKPVTKKDRKVGQYPYYGAMGIQDYVDSFIFDGDYLLVGEDGAKWGANDKSAFQVHGKCWVNNHAHILKVNEDEICSSFIEHYLVGKDLSSYITGAVVPKLTQASLVSIPIPLPPLPIQQKIVAELDKVCLIIDKKKQQLKELDNLAQAIFYDMFGDPVDNEKGWEVKTMGEIGTLQRGSGLSRKDLVENGHPCILYGQIHTRFGAFTKTHIACIPDYLVNTAKIAHTGDLIMAITSEDVEGSCKSTAWLGNYDIAIGSDAAIFRHNQNGIYISYYTKTKAFYNEKAKFARGFKVTHISTKEIATIPIMIPPLSLQQSFAAKIEAIEKQKELISRSIKEAQTLFDERMDYWFD